MLPVRGAQPVFSFPLVAMDFLSLLGLLVAAAAILGGQWLEGGHIGSLLQATAFFIVVGGTLGAVMLQVPLPTFSLGLRMAGWAFRPPVVKYGPLIERMAHWSNVARRGGLLALEPQLDAVQDAFEGKGLRLLVDGADPDALREILERELDTWEECHRAGAKVWEAAGGYAPTIGILGAVMGLIHVMENLTDPNQLGAGIAVAFVATIYGIGSANLAYLPLAGKLRTHVGREVKRREMVIDALTSIAVGANPRVIEAKLEGYLAEGDT